MSIVFDYKNNSGPWCTDHRSTQCDHATRAIQNREDVPHIERFLAEASTGDTLSLLVPMWPGYFMWEDLTFQVVPHPSMGAVGKLLDRGKFSTYDLGVYQVLPGESGHDLAATMIQQFIDIMELDRPTKLPGCRAPRHSMKYQSIIDDLARRSDSSQQAQDSLIPHLYGLLGRKAPMCAFCWADAYGQDARRVSGVESEASKADDFSDLLFQG